jgi:ribonucleotide monophosphatase NagD (HAD superfamily)
MLSHHNTVLLPNCPAEFIQLLSSEANELAMGDNKSTITPEHVVRALQQLGFEEWADDVKHSHEQFKAEAKRERRCWLLDGVLSSVAVAVRCTPMSSVCVTVAH